MSESKEKSAFPERVVYVEDNASLRELMRDALSERFQDIVFVTCMDGEELLNRFKELQPDLILLDLILGEMHGPDVLMELHKRHDNFNIPVIFVTGKTKVEMTPLYRKLGVIDVIHKPYDPVEIPDIIVESLERWEEQGDSFDFDPTQTIEEQLADFGRTETKDESVDPLLTGYKGEVAEADVHDFGQTEAAKTAKDYGDVSGPGSHKKPEGDDAAATEVADTGQAEEGAKSFTDIVEDDAEVGVSDEEQERRAALARKKEAEMAKEQEELVDDLSSFLDGI